VIDKFEIYDVVGVLVPGVLVVAAVPLAFPSLASQANAAHFPEGFVLLALTALSIFVGHLVQTLASLIEPILNKTWGGRPSDSALKSGLGPTFFPLDSAKRIRSKLVEATSPDASNHSLFLFASQLAESSESARAGRFNALYAYHRSLVVLSIVSLMLFIGSSRGGFASTLTCSQYIVVLVFMLGLLAVLWHRTKRRGWYYVREVLLCAEQKILLTLKP